MIGVAKTDPRPSTTHRGGITLDPHDASTPGPDDDLGRMHDGKGFRRAWASVMALRPAEAENSDRLLMGTELP